MEDGPEEDESEYEFNGKTYRLEEPDSEVWSVYDGDAYLGIVRAMEPEEGEPGPHFEAKLPGDENDPDGVGTDADITDDWRSAIEWLIDQATE